jgi:branched-chain amino acid transport system substrate-binding protein
MPQKRYIPEEPKMLRLKITPARFAAGVVAATALALMPNFASAQSGEPIKIGFSMSLTGPLAANGKQALLGAKIWEEEINGKGGLIGRPVKLIFYDDQSNPSQVPSIYTKLLDVDKVDLVVSSYATNMIAPAMPVVMAKNKTFISLFGLDVNAEFKYPKYFSILPTGQDTKESFTEGFYETAMKQNPKPTTVALAAEDAEFSRNACEGARANAKKFNLKVVYDRAYPPSTTDYAPIVRAVQAANPDLFIICSYPLSSVGMVQTINELNYKPKMVGGAMVGLQATVFKQRLGSKLNGIVNYETWVPTEKSLKPAAEFFKKYQAKAGADGVDPIGYYLGGWGYAWMNMLGEAVASTKSIDDDKIADYLRKTPIKTIMGDWSYGGKGEWTKSGMIQVQYHNVKDGNDLEQWRGMAVQTVLTPADQKTGEVIYPYEKAK